MGRHYGSAQRTCGSSSIQKAVHSEGIWGPLTDFARWAKGKIEEGIVKLLYLQPMINFS
jgi:hypothetical protein